VGPDVKEDLKSNYRLKNYHLRLTTLFQSCRIS